MLRRQCADQAPGQLSHSSGPWRTCTRFSSAVASAGAWGRGNPGDNQSASTEQLARSDAASEASGLSLPGYLSSCAEKFPGAAPLGQTLVQFMIP